MPLPQYTFEQDVLRILDAVEARVQQDGCWEETIPAPKLTRQQSIVMPEIQEAMESIPHPQQVKEAEEAFLATIAKDASKKDKWDDLELWRLSFATAEDLHKAALDEVIGAPKEGAIDRFVESLTKSSKDQYPPEYEKELAAFAATLDETQRDAFKTLDTLRKYEDEYRAIERMRNSQIHFWGDNERAAKMHERMGLDNEGHETLLSTCELPRGITPRRASAIVDVLKTIELSSGKHRKQYPIDPYKPDTLRLGVKDGHLRIATTFDDRSTAALVTKIRDARDNVQDFFAAMRTGWELSVDKDGAPEMHKHYRDSVTVGNEGSILDALERIGRIRDKLPPLPKKRANQGDVKWGLSIDLDPSAPPYVETPVDVEADADMELAELPEPKHPPFFCSVKGRSAIQKLLVEEIGVPGVQLPPGPERA